MQFVRAETLVQEITSDGKVRDIVTERVKSEAEKEADRKEQILRDLPEFKRARAAGSGAEQLQDAETQAEQDKEKEQENRGVHTIDEDEFEHYQKLEDAEVERARQRRTEETAAVQRFASEKKRALESGEAEGPDLLAKMARQAREKAEAKERSAPTAADRLRGLGVRVKAKAAGTAAAEPAAAGAAAGGGGGGGAAPSEGAGAGLGLGGYDSDSDS